MTPGFLGILSPPEQTDAAKPPAAQGKTSGLLLAFAEWLTSPNHPLTARVIVNRLWQGPFGTGIVATSDNFGKTGAPASNQPLLDYLALDFIKNGWSAKRLHKQIMMSTAYRQSSEQNEKANRVDPDNALLWRMNLRRLDAEALRDSVMAVAGKLDLSAGGAPIQLEMRPDGLQVVSSKEPEPAKWRRSIYLTHRRTYPMSFLGVDPIIDTNCTQRVPSAPPQSLTMLNDDFVWQAAEALAQRARDDIAAVEFLCVKEMAMAKWRLRRVVSLETAAGNKHLGETTATGGAGTLAAFTAAQQAGQLLTTLRQHEAAYSRAYQRAYKHLQQLREVDAGGAKGEARGSDGQ